MNYLAHYDKEKDIEELLSVHLQAMADSVKDAVPPVVEFPELKGETMIRFAEYILRLHDFGKYTDYFQDYIRDGKNSELKVHAHISACIAHPVLVEILSSLPLEYRYAWTFVAYVCIRFHHGSLISFANLFNKEREKEMWNMLEQQAVHLLAKGESIFLDANLLNEWKTISLINPDFLSDLRTNKRHFLNMPHYLTGRMKGEHWYFALLYFFSLLIDLDKLHSSGVDIKKVRSISHERVEQYIEEKHGKKSSSSLVNRREQAKQTMLNQIFALSDEQIQTERFFTVTAPTGIGKTLASLQSALLLQERIQRIEKYTPRIVTAIPFINIIEQTKTDYENICGDSVRLMIHHRLTDIVPEKDASLDTEEKAMEKRMMEIESWEADIILTTFVQFFSSLITGENRPLKKVRKLAGSIVILDEVQSLPEKYMPLLGAVLRKIAQYYGTRFILMTATQPKLLEMGDQLLRSSYVPPVELLVDYPKFFKEMRRTRIVPVLDETVENEQFLSFFFDKWKKSQSALIVVNTIQRSIELYNELEKLKREGEVPSTVSLFYLSTNIVPKHRQDVIQEVRDKLKGKKPVILVSTQTIEAGVDLDFDIGFRDLAPLESIVQTAGRVNREGGKGEYAPVYIVQFKRDCSRVYSLHHWERTKSVLQKHEDIKEPEYQALIEKYYRELMESGISDESRQLWEEGILGLNFEKLKEFALIENIGQVVDVFVEMNEEATQFADAYEEIKSFSNELDKSKLYSVFDKKLVDDLKTQPSAYERKTLLRLILAKMSRYMVQVRLQRAFKNRPIEFSARNGIVSDIFWVPPNQLEQFYDQATGFIDETGSSFL
ncbi:CRISPR-associated helicase Cas3' [Aneurinibacillus sp. UBA3580]|jgi:CRISPR-associated endonuclease/helicase Cas3|uniref:CRISPR-associated helicase Cas3' n=1 Tax=Aneurinibacillus sp. UBA3580 TaxID=1946041 RepID=UPI00257C1D97|nr:CRISPR-associated helicase Cas3' [Aneurinibacillus sp. UBA3580]